MPRFFLSIPGIFQNPSGEDDWSDRACAYVEAHFPVDYARDYEYRCGVFKSFGQARRIQRVRDYLNAFADCERHVLSHSNGGDIACKVLLQNPRIKVKALHLIAAATPAHCGANGLNTIAKRGQVEKVHLYMSDNDRALWFGGLTWDWLHYLGRGFGDLGRGGPVNVEPELAAIIVPHRDDRMGHCDWVSGDNLTELLRNVTA